ncbi:alcohol dehydrogenase GroES domain-containing protein [Mycena maculata]|uniref:Alcohol dehydrogenase GroES domain-containing protein n=1 Tax=Mycena maculata TaxID=230809 RepID=A0AAD7HPM7_9AGAR|nr:alcohol dehydrogenase GroES domain-containing protein [Mycena maculata]
MPSINMSTYRALQFSSPTTSGTIITKPTPSLPLPPGTALLKPLYAGVVSYTTHILQNGNPRKYNYPLPLVPGPSCIARVVAAPPDAPALTPGQLVLLDPTIRARDLQSDGAAFLLGYSGGPPGATPYTVMEAVWRDGTFAERVQVPVENVHPLDEAALCGRLGYALTDLAATLGTLAVSFGGLDAARVRPGETVVVAPATGSFGGGAVHVALALGARVVAMGRNETALAGLEALGDARVAAVRMSGSVEGDVVGITSALERLGSRSLDVFFEISPPSVVNGPGQTVPYTTAALKVLRKGGRAVFMGGVKHDVSLPLREIVHGAKTLQGVWMYTPAQLTELIRLVEAGVLRLGEDRGFACQGVFPLERWEEAFETASREASAGNFVLLQPNQE